MGQKKSRKRRIRRTLKQGIKARPVHKLIGGRTGSKAFKRRGGMLAEKERRGQ